MQCHYGHRAYLAEESRLLMCQSDMDRTLSLHMDPNMDWFTPYLTQPAILRTDLGDSQQAL